MRTQKRIERKHFHVARREHTASRERAMHAPQRVCKAPRVLIDGAYDAMVIDVDERDDALVLDLAITGGAQKGEVVRVRTARREAQISLELLGLPATLRVVDGQPEVTFE
jgi:hypothetical protein